MILWHTEITANQNGVFRITGLSVNMEIYTYIFGSNSKKQNKFEFYFSSFVTWQQC